MPSSPTRPRRSWRWTRSTRPCCLARCGAGAAEWRAPGFVCRPLQGAAWRAAAWLGRAWPRRLAGAGLRARACSRSPRLLRPPRHAALPRLPRHAEPCCTVHAVPAAPRRRRASTGPSRRSRRRRWPTTSTCLWATCPRVRSFGRVFRTAIFWSWRGCAACRLRVCVGDPSSGAAGFCCVLRVPQPLLVV